MLSRKLTRLVIVLSWLGVGIYILSTFFAILELALLAIVVWVTAFVIKSTKLRCPVCGRNSVLLRWDDSKKYYCYRCGSETIYDDTIV